MKKLFLSIVTIICFTCVAQANEKLEVVPENNVITDVELPAPCYVIERELIGYIVTDDGHRIPVYEGTIREVDC